MRALLRFLVLSLVFGVSACTDDGAGRGNPSTDKDACEGGSTRCVEEILQKCDNGTWRDWTDCAAKNQICALEEGSAECRNVGQTGDTETERPEDTSDTESERPSTDSVTEVSSDDDTERETEPIDTASTDSDTGSETADSEGSETGSGSTDTDTTTEDTETGTDEEQCVETGYKIERKPVNMLILLDRSRSIGESTVGEQTSAEVVAQGIKNVVQTNDDKDLINFGLAVFPDLTCVYIPGVDPGEDVQCKASSSTAVDIGPDNFSQISSELDSMGYCGGTPLCHTLNWAKAYLQTLDANLSKFETYVLLVTDGAPNCNTTGDIGSCECTTEKTPQGVCPGQILCLDDKCSYNEALSLRKQGNKLFVIGFGDEAASWEYVMNKMAEYGGTGSYYPARDTVSLNSSLQSITNEVLQCDFDVAWAEIPKKNDDGGNIDKKCNKVRVLKIADMDNPSQTENIPYSHDCSDPNGWRWKGLEKELDPETNDDTLLSECSTIELCSKACENLKNGETERVFATFGCGIIPAIDTDTETDTSSDVDECPGDPLKTEPGICGCGTPDSDRDDDGTPDCYDYCPEDPEKTNPGACGCGFSDEDSDDDGTVNCLDECPSDPNKTSPGICDCGTADEDSDGDGTVNCLDGCPNDPDKTAPGICGCGVPDGSGC